MSALRYPCGADELAVLKEAAKNGLLDVVPIIKRPGENYPLTAVDNCHLNRFIDLIGDKYPQANGETWRHPTDPRGDMVVLRYRITRAGIDALHVKGREK